MNRTLCPGCGCNYPEGECAGSCPQHAATGEQLRQARAAKVASIKASRPATHVERTAADEGKVLAGLAAAWRAFFVGMFAGGFLTAAALVAACFSAATGLTRFFS